MDTEKNSRGEHSAISASRIPSAFISPTMQLDSSRIPTENLAAHHPTTNVFCLLRTVPLEGATRFFALERTRHNSSSSETETSQALRRSGGNVALVSVYGSLVKKHRKARLKNIFFVPFRECSSCQACLEPHSDAPAPKLKISPGKRFEHTISGFFLQRKPLRPTPSAAGRHPPGTQGLCWWIKSYGVWAGERSQKTASI